MPKTINILIAGSIAAEAETWTVLSTACCCVAPSANNVSISPDRNSSSLLKRSTPKAAEFIALATIIPANGTN